MKIEVHAIAKGQVQGVGYRATVRYHALRYDLKGIVKNLPDDSVELFAQGEREVLDQFLEAIRTEASGARVDALTTRFYPPKTTYDSFNIS